MPRPERLAAGGLHIFSDGRALRDTVQQRFFDERFARLAAVKGTEAIQPNDGRILSPIAITCPLLVCILQ